MTRDARRLARFCLAAVACMAAFAFAPAVAQQPKPPLAERITPEILHALFPTATSIGAEEGLPPSVAVYEGETEIGYIFSTFDVVRSPGYSSYIFDVLGGVTPASEVTGGVVIDHQEPHIRNDERRQVKLVDFLDSFAGYDVERNEGPAKRPDFVGGATVSARAMRAALLDSARIILRNRLGIEPVTEPTLDRDGFWPIPWDTMVADGELSTLRILGSDVVALLAEHGIENAQLPRNLGDPADVYSDVFIGLGSIMAVSRNVMTAANASEILAERPEGSEAILIGSNGRYDVFGTSYTRSASGFRFDRIQVVQDDKVFTFTRDDFRRIGLNAIQRGRLQYAGLFYIPAGSGFDPLKPWRLDFFIMGTSPAGNFSIPLPIEYNLSEAHILMPPPPPVPAYVEAWTEARTDILILAGMLATLTLILAFQGFIARHRRVFELVRNGFLLFTLVWLGWMAGGQLSTIHLINYATAPLHGFDIGFYLSEPLIVIVAAYSLIALVVLGRGVFCGWLCPFGSLQELLAKVARALRLPQWNPSEELARKLWVGKYIAAVLVIGATFTTPDMAAAAEEVEPFKTAITALFVRGWPFVTYAVVLLVLGLFTERAYCRFLCPLGGTLAALDRLHLVDMLKRREECGSPCRLCENSCPVKAIDRSGRINMAECFQCLDCQVEYYDDQRCPPLAKVRKQLARATGIVPSRGITIPVPAMARGVAT